MINPKLLTAFVEVAELRSFRAAAERLNRSQSALSMQIRDLEAQLGVALLHRSTRAVTVTAEGECLLDYARRAIRELDNGLARIKVLGNQHRGRVKVACVPSVAGTRLPQVISRFQQEYPSVEIEIFEFLAKRLHEAVARRLVDFGIGPISPSTSEFNTISLFVEPICAVFSQDVPRRPSRGVTLKDLQGFSILTTGSDTLQRDMLEEAQIQAGIRLRITHRVAQAQTLLSMVSAGLGVAIVPEIAMETPGHAALHAYPIVSPALSREMAILSHRDRCLTNAAARFAEALETTLAIS